jgi:MOSC domain-containing protein YiiM
MTQAEAAVVDESLLAEYAARLNALCYASAGMVEALILSPRIDEHVSVPAIRIVPGQGIEGQYPGKQWWQGERVPGRQVSAVNAEVLDILDILCEVPGDNLIIRGIDLTKFEPEDVLRIGDAFLVATATPHRPCSKLARRTTLTKMKAISQGRLRGTMFDALRPATITVGDMAERLLMPLPPPPV